MLIVASGSIGDLDGRPVDILGLGLKGTAGLVRYLTLLAVLLGITLAAVPLAARSWRDRGIVRRLAAWLPGIGPALVAAEAAAWCRAAAMAGHAGLNAGRLVELAAGAAPGLRISAAEIESRLRAGEISSLRVGDSSISGSIRCLELRLAISTVGDTAIIGPGAWWIT